MDRRFKAFVATAIFVLLRANAVPTTDAVLFDRADLVVNLRVTSLDVRKISPNGSTLNCIEGTVTRWLKGESQDTIAICDNNISEMSPPPPKKGGHYRFYLLASPIGVYETFSYAGSELLSD